jgi:menaquinone-specific isochorismate synthase
VKPDHDQNVDPTLTISTALRRLIEACQNTPHWIHQRVPLGTPRDVVTPLFAQQNDWAIWRDKEERVLMGIGPGKRQHFSNWRAASRTSDAETEKPPFTFFGGRFDETLAPQDTAWQTWPHTELYTPSFVLEWSSQADSTPKVWTHAKHVQWTRRICLKLSIQTTHPLSSTAASTWSPVESRQSWIERVCALHEQFQGGKLKKVVMARSVSSQIKMADPAVVRALHELIDNPSKDIVFALCRPSGLFFGCTPETLADVQPEWILTHALAGTQSVDQTEAEFIGDEKIQREHASVVDDLCGKLRAMSDDVTTEGSQLRYTKALVHLETQIRARVTNVHILDVVDKLHPTPALGGSPTQPALRWLRENEPLDRGWFGGPVGWFNAEGHGGCAVAIRCALLTQDHAQAFAGAGIVDGSDPDAEWQETTDKLGTILNVFNGVVK